MRKAIFIDKDGTLIKNVPYNINLDTVRLEDGVGETLCLLSRFGYKFFVITNQSGIARGLFSETKLALVFERIQSLLRKFEVKISGFYYCPHFIEGTITKYAKTCSCRKPAPGLILQAAADHNINLSSSWMIGDILRDTEAGNRAGCKTVLINNGNETEWHLSPQNMPQYIASTFHQIVDAVYFSDQFKKSIKQNLYE